MLTGSSTRPGFLTRPASECQIPKERPVLADGGGQDGGDSHAHLMFSERTNDGIERSAAQWFKRYNAKEPEKEGARKTTATKPRDWLEQTREAWALERAGRHERITEASLETQYFEAAEARRGIQLIEGALEFVERQIREFTEQIAERVRETLERNRPSIEYDSGPDIDWSR